MTNSSIKIGVTYDEKFYVNLLEFSKLRQTFLPFTGLKHKF